MTEREAIVMTMNWLQVQQEQLAILKESVVRIQTILKDPHALPDVQWEAEHLTPDARMRLNAASPELLAERIQALKREWGVPE